MVRLESVAQAVAYLEGLRTGQDLSTEVSFGGELAAIRIDIEGPEFHGSITGELSRGLASYQDQIYRAAKFALYGRDGRFQLTAEQRKAFELVFEVREGSSDLLGAIEPIVDGLKAGIVNMDPQTLAYVIVAVVLILVAGSVATKIFESLQATKQKKIEAETTEAQLTAVTDMAQQAIAESRRVVEVLAHAPGPIPHRFELAQSEGIKEVLKSVPTATQVDVAGVKFDSDDIKELRRRSPRAKAEYAVVREEFRVFADTVHTPVRLTLSGASLPGEFTADFPDDLESAQANLLWQAIREKGTAVLEVSATIVRDKVKSAVITDVVIPEQLPDHEARPPVSRAA